MQGAIKGKNLSVVCREQNRTKFKNRPNFKVMKRGICISLISKSQQRKGDLTGRETNKTISLLERLLHTIYSSIFFGI